MLILENQWHEAGHHFVRWRPASRNLLREAKNQLAIQLRPYLSLHCTHVKGRGGAKAAVRYVHRLTDQFTYVARFDIRAYYESMDHGVLLAQLEIAGVEPMLQDLVRHYLSLPDETATGKGMVAGGAISPLLGRSI